MLVCLTGTVVPQIKKDYHTSTGINSRLREYVGNIFFLLTNSPFDRIVFCENSSYQHEIFSTISQLAHSLGKSFEYLTFSGNTDGVNRLGRGYGEQEILEYFLNNSILLEGENSFYKITGRYRVINIKQVIESNGSRENIFFYMSPWHRRVSTAFFRSSVSFFQESLTGCGEEIDDKKGESYQIEGIYTKRLKKRSHNIQPSKILPIFLANTGSGYTLQPNSLKDGIKFLLNLLRLYSI